MIHGSTEKVFIYSNGAQVNLFDKQLEDLHSFSAFTTGNIYQLQQYTKAMPPRVLVFNVTDASALADLKFVLNHLKTDFPLIVTMPESMELQPNDNVAHYIYHKDLRKLTDVVESYCLGGKKHDVMLLAGYSSKSNRFKNLLQKEGYSLFEVHKVEAARQYLERNDPRVVCVEYSPRFIAARHTLQHQRIFYVDRAQDITEIKKILH